MGEDRLVLERLRRTVAADHRRRLVRRVGARAVEPVVRVDRHHVALDERVDVGRVVAGDVGRELDVVVVLVPEVRDQRDDLVAGAGVVAGWDDPELLEHAAVPLARRRRAEGGRHLREHVAVELADEVRGLRVGDHVADAVVAAVARREVEVVRDPDLDLLADGAQREELEAGAAGEDVDHRPLLLRPHGWAGNGGSGDTGARAAGLRGRDRADRLRRVHLDVADVENVAERIAGERRCRHGEGERRNRQRCHCSSHCFLPLLKSLKSSPCAWHGHMADSD